MPPRKQALLKISEEKLKSISQKAEEHFTQKPKEVMTTKEVIVRLRGVINKALKRGYSYEEIADFLAEEGIMLKGTTIKQYIAESSRSQRAPKRSKQSVASPASTVETAAIQRKRNQESTIKSQSKPLTSGRFVEMPERL